MAVGIQNYPNIDTTDPTNYPNGCINDDPAGAAGTPINKETTNDIHITFDRALRQAGITASGDPDNEVNGYEYGKAFGLEQWTDLGTSLTITADTGSITVAPGDIFYNKYQLVGRTFKWQLQILSVTVSGSPNILVIDLPTAITSMGLTFAHDLSIQINSYDRSSPSLCMTTTNVSGGFGADKILLQHVDGTNFTNGTNDQWYYMTIECELI